MYLSARVVTFVFRRAAFLMKDDTCLFCKIVAAEIPAQVIHQCDCYTAFCDIQPQAPMHLLVVPNAHVASHADVPAGENVFEGLFQVAQHITQQLNLTDYRLVINNGAGAGQSVFHLHLHILAGRSFAWPPG
jgi:histidine triad (HIT) family protein